MLNDDIQQNATEALEHQRREAVKVAVARYDAAEDRYRSALGRTLMGITASSAALLIYGKPADVGDDKSWFWWFLACATFALTGTICSFVLMFVAVSFHRTIMRWHSMDSWQAFDALDLDKARCQHYRLIWAETMLWMQFGFLMLSLACLTFGTMDIVSRRFQLSLETCMIVSFILGGVVFVFAVRWIITRISPIVRESAENLHKAEALCAGIAAQRPPIPPPTVQNAETHPDRDSP